MYMHEIVARVLMQSEDQKNILSIQRANFPHVEFTDPRTLQTINVRSQADTLCEEKLTFSVIQQHFLTQG